MIKSPSIKNLLILIFLAIIWGSSYILMKRGLVAFSAMQVSSLRIIISFLVLSPFLRMLNKKDLPFLLLTAIFGSGLPTYIYPIAIEKIDSSVVGVINSLTPVFTVIFGLVLFKIKTTWFSILGLIIALIGASLLILKGNNISNLTINSYALLAILAPLLYGFSSNILKFKLSHIPAKQITAFTFALLFPFALAMLLQTNFIEIIKSEPNVIESLAYISILAIVGTALALVVFNYLIKETSAVYASSVTFLMPAVVLLWGVFDNEDIGFIHIIALNLILFGVYVLNYYKKKKKVLN